MKAALVAPTSSGVAASVQALAAIAGCTFVAHQTNQTQIFLRFDPLDVPPTSLEIGKTFLRTLVVPSLVEEVLWRVILQPPGTSLSYIVGINLAFAIYHVFGSTFLAERIDGRQGARAVFWDPAFLTLAFVLGNACTWAHVRSNYSLWAPVITHAVPVTVWLSFLHGDEALSTPDGLHKSTTSKE